jgi:phospholipid transport system substrate-binding protein
MKTYTKLKYFLLSGLFFFSTLACAAPSPVDMLQNISNQMLSSLSKVTDRNDQALYNLVKRILLPHVDLNGMSELVVGKYWANASPTQRAQFAQEFTHFITRTYSNALSSYSNEKVRFFPIRGGVTGNRVQVSSAIDQANGQSVSVSYRLTLANGEWKVYDFSVEGVSIVENYRSQFADALRTNGLAGLIQQLHQQNQGQR